MRVFVTGGNGFIGSHVVARLIEEGHQVVCLVRESSDTSRIDHLDWTKLIGDIRDTDVVKTGVSMCDATIHMANPSAWKEIESAYATEVAEAGTTNVLSAVKAIATNGSGESHRVVYMSSAATVAGTGGPKVCTEVDTFAQGENGFRYAHAKQHCESLCMEAFSQGVNVVILNPGEVIGPNDIGMVTAGNFKDVTSGPVALVTKGGAGFVHVDDVAGVTVKALTQGGAGERYLLSGGNLTTREAAIYARKILGKQERAITIPSKLVLALAKFSLLTKIPMPFEPRLIPYAVLFWYLDASKAEQTFDIRFRSAEEGIRDTVEWLVRTGQIEAKVQV